MQRSVVTERAEPATDSYDVKPNGLESAGTEPAHRATSSPTAPDSDELSPHVRRRSWIKVSVGVLVFVAFLSRLVAADRLSLWVDEPVSMLAAFEVADRGIPVLPSGKLYLQGATLSYLLAPVALAGYDDLEDFQVLRLVSVIAGTAAVVALFFLTRGLTSSIFGGFLSGLLLALDPSSVRWSSYVRMYALLQLCSVLLIWLFLRLLFSSPSRRHAIGLVSVFWFGVFSQIAIVLFLPPMALCALWVCGRSLFNRRRDLLVSLAACAVAPLVFVGLNRLVKPPGLDAESASIDADFVGAHILSLHRFLNPTIDSWLLLFRGTELLEFGPLVVFGASCILVGRYFLGVPNGPGAMNRRRVLGAVLLLYWMPIAIVGTFSSLQQPRYLIHIQPLGYLLITLLVLDLVVGWRAPGPSRFLSRVPSTRQASRSVIADTLQAGQPTK